MHSWRPPICVCRFAPSGRFMRARFKRWLPAVAGKMWTAAFPGRAFAVRSYSQEGEDLILARLLENTPSGLYVDIGAHHPFRFSNTRLLYERGWHGINI